MKINAKRIIRHIVFTLSGALIGYLLYLWVGCPTGTCAITSNPVSAMIYMSLVGWLISLSISKGCDKCNT